MFKLTEETLSVVSREANSAIKQRFFAPKVFCFDDRTSKLYLGLIEQDLCCYVTNFCTSNTFFAESRRKLYSLLKVWNSSFGYQGAKRRPPTNFNLLSSSRD